MDTDSQPEFIADGNSEETVSSTSGTSMVILVIDSRKDIPFFFPDKQ